MDGTVERRTESNPHQRTAEWFQAREGKLTASSFGEALGLIGSWQRCFRRIKGIEVFEGNEATMWGEANEPVAIADYQQATGLNVQQVGFVRHRDIEWLGGSPDALTDNRLIEIKCPFSQEVYETVPPYYMAQVQGLLEITEKPIGDLCVWTPSAIRVFTIQRSGEYWLWMYPRLAEFWAYVQANVEPPRAKKSTFDYADLIVDVQNYLS